MPLRVSLLLVLLPTSLSLSLSVALSLSVSLLERDCLSLISRVALCAVYALGDTSQYNQNHHEFFCYYDGEGIMMDKESN